MAAAHFVLALCLAPLLPGIADWVTAIMAGRSRRPVFSRYREWLALAEQGTAYPPETGPVSRAAPVLILACMTAAMSLVPIGGQRPLLSFAGDFMLVVFFLVLARAIGFAAGSEGGPVYRVSNDWARPATMFTEPLLFFALMPLGLLAGNFSLGGMFAPGPHLHWSSQWPVLLPLALAMLFLACHERAALPSGDCDAGSVTPEEQPSGGLDRALRDYGQALKLWFLAALVSGFFPPRIDDPLAAFGAGVGGIFTALIAVGICRGLLLRLGLGGKKLLPVCALLIAAGAAAAVFRILNGAA